MKIFSIIVLVLIAAMLVIAGLSEAEPGYGKVPAIFQAVTISSLLAMAYFTIYGFLRNDKYILGAIMFSVLQSGYLILRLQANTNQFGMIWGIMISISANGVVLCILGVLRMIYVAVKTRSNPLNAPVNTL